MAFIRKYFEYPSGRKEWCVTGEFGSLSFWFTAYPDNYEFSDGMPGYGGVETHYNEKSKPEYLSDGGEHLDCICNGGKCWHDGASLWASEYWIPYVLPYGDKYIWEKLEYNYDLKNNPGGGNG